MAALSPPGEDKKGPRKSEYNEQLLLKEWDFDKFFKGFNDRLDQLNSESKGTKAPKGTTPPPIEGHKRVDSDSRVPTYGFRRENSDFFPAATRHSAVFMETKPLEGREAALGRGGRRGSDTVTVPASAIATKEKPEPQKAAKDSSKPKFTNYFDFKKDVPTRPRREKTDGEIVVKPRGDSLLARRRDIRDGEASHLRRRSNQPSPSNISSQSFDGGNLNGGFNGSAHDFQAGFNSSTLSSVSFSDFQVSFVLLCYHLVFILFGFVGCFHNRLLGSSLYFHFISRLHYFTKLCDFKVCHISEFINENNDYLLAKL